MDYYTTREIGLKWHITKRRVQILCAEGRIEGAIKIANLWLIPKNTLKPADLRYGYRQEIHHD
jgi:hypothetical protein